MNLLNYQIKGEEKFRGATERWLSDKSFTPLVLGTPQKMKMVM